MANPYSSIQRLIAENATLTERVKALEAADEDADGTLVQAVQEMKRLKDENTRLRAENAAMRPVVEAVAQAEAEPMQLYASEEDTVYVAELAASEGWEDEAISVRLPRDTYEQARAFVAAHPATSTAAGEAESEA